MRTLRTLAALAPIIVVIIAAIELIPAFGQWLFPHAPLTQAPPPTYTPSPTYTSYSAADVTTPTAIVIVITATPVPVTATHTALPQSSPVILGSTATPSSPPLPTETPRPTQSLNTPPGSILEVGQSWRQDNILLTLAERNLLLYSSASCNVGLGFRIENLASSSIIVTVRGSQVSVEDNLGHIWQRTGLDFPSLCPANYDGVFSGEMEPGGHFPSGYGYQYWRVGFAGDLTDPAVDYLIVTVSDLLQFDGAEWKIPINN